MFKLCFYVPVDSADNVKNAVFIAGGGEIGDYSCCCFETLGTGQFLPNEKANPVIGCVGKIEKVPELKVELVVDGDKIKTVVEALITAHPYEEPAYQFWPVLTLDDLK
jgi:hypothetical protein